MNTQPRSHSDRPQVTGSTSSRKALTEIEQFNEEIGADLPEDDVDTIGGLVASHLGRMPHKGEVFDLENLRFEVLRADARQIHVLLVEKLPLPEDDHD